MKKRHLQLGLLLFVGLAVVVYVASSLSQSLSVSALEVSAQRAFVNESCVGCHNDKAKTADISLQNVDFDNVSRHADVWEKVLRKVRTGQMPPAGMPPPSPTGWN